MPKPDATPSPEPQQTPTPPAAPDAAVMTGGPGVTPADAPGPAKIRWDQRDWTVTPDVAEAWERREKQFEAKFAEYSQEIGALRQRAREWEAQQERLRTALVPNGQPNAEPDLDTLLFTNPKQALALHERQILAKLEGQRQVEKDRAEFWDTFYGTHKDLDRSHDHYLVESVLQRPFPDLASLPVEEGHKKLGDLTRAEIMRFLKKRASGSSGSPRTVVEGASGRVERSAAPAEDEGPRSLTDVINARRAMKRSPAREKAS